MTTGSDEQRPAPQLVSGSIEFATPEEASAAFDRLKQLWMPAPESLPVGTDSARARPYWYGEVDASGFKYGCWLCEDGTPHGPHPQNTPAQRASFDWAAANQDVTRHEAGFEAGFIAGAEWARAEERKARGE